MWTAASSHPTSSVSAAPPPGERRCYGRAAWTGHALALLDTLGAAAVDVIGNSLGGAIARSMAARPAAVRRIVLMGSMGVAMALPRGLDAVWGYTPPGWSRRPRSFSRFSRPDPLRVSWPRSGAARWVLGSR